METNKDMLEDGFIKSCDTDRKTYRKLLHATKEGEVTRCSILRNRKTFVTSSW
ncbi:hypothetical protein H8S77_03055 [Parabacteroides sp. BX2]|uniref:Uncharacterized protein n=1 Tax=Parabacteroides segnis TaxID=2763058 RepID=A0ABR7DXK3_9BACT|nr:hypothetical protein [Parabacteroides segnis]MBC5641871.1 hypothetical protein [Parabacteroides segnis]